LDQIRAKQLVEPGNVYFKVIADHVLVTFGTVSFLEALSSLNPLENVKEMVSPKFFEYLRSQYCTAKSYRPIFRVDPDSIKPLPPKSPYILLGLPNVYEARDNYHFLTPKDEEFGIVKLRFPIDKQELVQSVYVNKYENVAVAHGFYFPGPVPFTWFGFIRNMWRYSRHWIENAVKSSRGERAGINKILWEMGDPGDALGFIVDVPMEAVMGIDIVDAEGKVVSGQSKELRKFVVTLRSNHVSPGWKFNSESVRWYIDDINLTTRRIKWATLDPGFWGTTMDPPKNP